MLPLPTLPSPLGISIMFTPPSHWSKLRGYRHPSRLTGRYSSILTEGLSTAPCPGQYSARRIDLASNPAKRPLAAWRRRQSHKRRARFAASRRIGKAMWHLRHLLDLVPTTTTGDDCLHVVNPVAVAANDTRITPPTQGCSTPLRI
jgi:hypothetical protein